MISTNRSARSHKNPTRRRPMSPSVEGLELRLVLSSARQESALQSLAAEMSRMNSPTGPIGPISPAFAHTGVSATNPDLNRSGGKPFLPPVVATPGHAAPGVIPKGVINANGTIIPFASSGPTGYTPQQLQTAYGLSQISFAGLKGDGTGQTIAIVDAYDNPSFVNSTDSTFSASALHLFDQQFGLPDPPSFVKLNQTGQAGPLPNPAAPNGWGVEIALDVEWAHVMAPGANIVLVEANDNSNVNMFAAAGTAGTVASVVSMSFGTNDSRGETIYDSTFNAQGVTFLAATGDSSAYSPMWYPSTSPHVVAVGGTSLQNLNATGDYPGTGTNGEVGWFGSGGGVSKVEPEPSYQQSVQTTGFRTGPDISADADSNTGAAVYDPYDFGGATPWAAVGGTSLSTPMMAGMAAIADQGRVASGGQTFSSDQFLTALYDLNTTKPNDFHDIVNGFNRYSAGTGYDYVTGLGSPNGSALVPDLAGFDLNTHSTLVSIAVNPHNPSGDLGRSVSFTAMGTYADGTTVDITDSVTFASSNPLVATISILGLTSNIAPGTTTITASLGGITSPGDTLTVVNPTAIAITPVNQTVGAGTNVQFSAYGNFADGLSVNLTKLVNWTSTNQSVATIDTNGLATTLTGGTTVITASVGGLTSLGDSLTAVAPSYVVNTLSDDLDYTDGTTSLREAILYANAFPGNTITFDPTLFATPQTLTLTLGELELNATGNETIIAPAAGLTINGGGTDRVFQVDNGTIANFSGLTITGGATAGTGGGVNVVGGTLTLTDCTISGNESGTGGGFGGYGGGLNNRGGYVTLTGCTVSGNIVGDGSGGGGLSTLSNGTTTLTDCTVSNNTCIGGNAAGDGIIDYGVNVNNTLTNCTLSGNTGGRNGGGLAVYFNNSTATLINCTVSSNASSQVGGGVSTNYGGGIILTNCTISGNDASSGAGFFGFGPADVNNTIIAGNVSEDTNIYGTFTGSDNLIGGTALLAPLGNYEGPTQTMPLLPGSPAIGTGSEALAVDSLGNPLTTDQRGAPRTLNGKVDIGAFQSKGFTVAALPGSTPQSATIGTEFANPLALSVAAVDPKEPVNGGFFTFTAMPAANGATAIYDSQAGVIANGQTDFVAAPNNIDGSYSVVATASGLSITFQLTNVGPSYSNLVVNTTSDSIAPGAGLLSLREAIAFSDTSPSGNAPITFDAAVFASPETINLTGYQLELSNPMGTASIVGPAAGLTIAGGGRSRVFQVDGGVTANFSGLTVTGGATDGNGGGLNVQGGSISLTDCNIIDNSASNNGGGLYNSYGTLSLTDCNVNGNSSSLNGGGLFNSSGTVTLTNCSISGNSVASSAVSFGGGVYNRGNITLSHCTITGNSATPTDLYSLGAGGGLYNAGTAGLIGCVVSGNCSGQGSGLYNGFYATSLTLSECTISGNSASVGNSRAGGLINFTIVTLTNCTISGNTALYKGGGIISYGSATLTNCTISDNSVAGSPLGSYGGGLLLTGTSTLTNCTVSGNSASTNGGGIYSFFSAETILNDCTVSGNSSGGNGGGLFNKTFNGSFPVKATLNNCTISGNAAGNKGGGIYDDPGVTNTLTNTIVALNTGAAGADDIAGANVVTGTNNLIGVGGSGGLANGISGNIVGVVNPGLAPLANYGGPTETIALLPGSPAIDAGMSGTTIPNTDQRGEGRVGAIDIGAFESQGYIFTAATGSSTQSSNIGTEFAKQLGITVTPVNPLEPVNGGVVTFVAQPSPNGASALLSANTAVIANGKVAIRATPYDVLGSYTVIATTPGSTATFHLTNTGSVITKFVVNSTSDTLFPGTGLLTLRELIAFDNHLNYNLPITFDATVFASPQTITLKGGELELSNPGGTLSITGPAAGVSISGGGKSRVFHVDPGVTASFSNLTISGGKSAANGGGIFNEGTTSLKGVNLSGNKAINGGAIENTGTLTVKNSAFTTNAATSKTFADYGGAIDNQGGLTVSNSSFTGNTSDAYGGAISNINLANATITSSTFTSNVSRSRNGLGGGAAIDNSGTLTVSKSTLSNNTATIGGGGIENDNGKLVLTSSTISDNVTKGNGGGLAILGGSVSVSKTTFSGNTASTGGGIANIATLDIQGGTITGNTAKSNGGGLITGDGGTTTVTGTTASSNTATKNGGGIYNTALGSTTVTNATIKSNTAANGGGVFSLGTLNVNAGSIKSNTASTNGGGVDTGAGGTSTLNGTMISSNTATASGGGLFNASHGSTILTSDTVSSNSGVAGGGIFNQGTLTIDSSSIKNNTATSKGGGISTLGGSTTISNTSITGNKVNSSGTALGGGIDCEKSVLSLINCTISSNQVNGVNAYGGGIYAYKSTVSVVNSTISGNKANGSTDGEGGGIYADTTVLTLVNSQVKGNKATTAYNDIYNKP